MEREYIVKYVSEENGVFTKSDPLIRCKDCKHMKSLLCADGSSVIGCERWGMRGDDWYCADGEPKDGDGDG